MEVGPLAQSYYAHYYSCDDARTLLGGRLVGESSRFSHETDAETFLEHAIEVHEALDPPLRVSGSVLRSNRRADIVRDENGELRTADNGRRTA